MRGMCAMNLEDAAAVMARKLFALGRRVPAILDVECVLAEDGRVIVYVKVDGNFADLYEGCWLYTGYELLKPIGSEMFDATRAEAEFARLLPHAGTVLQ